MEPFGNSSVGWNMINFCDHSMGDSNEPCLANLFLPCVYFLLDWLLSQRGRPGFPGSTAGPSTSSRQLPTSISASYCEINVGMMTLIITLYEHASPSSPSDLHQTPLCLIWQLLLKSAFVAKLLSCMVFYTLFLTFFKKLLNCVHVCLHAEHV